MPAEPGDRPRVLLMRALSGSAAAVLLAGLLVLPGAPAYAADVACADLGADDPRPPTPEAVSAPLQALGVPAAQAYLRSQGVEPGAGVTVAVLDSGVVRDGSVPLASGLQAPSFGKARELVSYQGSAVAGLIAAPETDEGDPVGIAPAARIVDVRVYDALVPADDGTEVGVSASRVAQGLAWVLDRASSIDVVNVSLQVESTPEITDLVERLWRKGVIVVAQSGDRPTQVVEGSSSPFDAYVGEPRPGEDVVDVVFPAGYQRQVVAVSATAGGADVSGIVMRNSAVDVAAPTAGALSVALNGAVCVLPETSTSLAAAEVSGVVAMLISAYPDDTPQQTLDRLVNTAAGRPDVRSPLLGAGVVQADQAVSRILEPSVDGQLGQTQVLPDVERAVAPEPEPDVLAGTRRDAVWWGLLGGGALLLALVLRPVLSRRR